MRQSVLITGGDRGVGLAAAGRFAERSIRVCITHRSDEACDGDLAKQCDGVAVGVALRASPPTLCITGAGAGIPVGGGAGHGTRLKDPIVSFILPGPALATGPPEEITC